MPSPSVSAKIISGFPSVGAVSVSIGEVSSDSSSLVIPSPSKSSTPSLFPSPSVSNNKGSVPINASSASLIPSQHY